MNPSSGTVWQPCKSLLKIYTGSPQTAFMGLAIVIVSVFPGSTIAQDSDLLQTRLKQFSDYTGAKLVFDREDLPDGKYHDILKPLSPKKRVEAVKICLAEARLYPPNYFHDVGLTCIGVFAACVSKQSTHATRPYDQQLGGYRYFGVYNGRNAIAAAFYSDGQLPLTLHHEIFHHVDATVDGVTERWQISSDDAFYQAAVSGLRPRERVSIAVEDLEALRDQKIGMTLKDYVSEYAATNNREDQAETARHFMSLLPDALLQAAEQPELAGSQRILHVLKEYERSLPDGPGVDWFVDVALKRAETDTFQMSAEDLLTRLRQHARGGVSGFAGVERDPTKARSTLRGVARIDVSHLTRGQRSELTQLSVDVTRALMEHRIRPDRQFRRFDVWGREDSKGVNTTLRRDLARFAKDAERLSLIQRCSTHDPSSTRAVTIQQLRSLFLLSRYYSFIKSQWSMTVGTKRAFESAKERIVQSVISVDPSRKKQLGEIELEDVSDGTLEQLQSTTQQSTTQ